MSWEENVRKVVPYVAGEQPKSANKIKLNTNECPYPPAPGVQELTGKLDSNALRLYPDSNTTMLVEPLAGDAAPFGVCRCVRQPFDVLPVFEPFAHRWREPVAVLAHGLGVADDGSEQLAGLDVRHGRVAAGDGPPQVSGLFPIAGVARVRVPGNGERVGLGAGLGLGEARHRTGMAGLGMVRLRHGPASARRGYRGGRVRYG